MECWLLLFLLTASTRCLSTDGSKMIINTSPSPFTPMLSPLLSLRCSIEDSPPATASSNVIGKRQKENSTDGNMFPISAKIAFVSSLTILRNNEDVASVSEHFPVKALMDTSNLVVKGNIGDSNGERASLDLTWTQPTVTQRGNYSCIVSGYNTIGHPIIYTGSVVVESSTPTIDDLVSHVYSQGLDIKQLKHNQTVLREEIHNQEVQITNQEVQITNQEVHITNQEVKITNQEAQITNLKGVQQQQETKSNQMMDLINKNSHVESGVVSCGDLSPHVNSAVRTASFSRPYSKVPKVHVALLDLHIYEDKYAFLDITVTSTTTQWFTVRCNVKSVYNQFIGTVRIAWVSFSNSI